MTLIGRKTAILTLGLTMLMGCSNNGESEFSSLEEDYNAKIGVYALDTGSGDSVSYNEGERFAYASTHKALTAAVLLQKNDIDELNKTVTIEEDELVDYSPVTENFIGEEMTLMELAEASLHQSDNTAGNLILREIGGPEGFKEALLAIGDNVTNPVRSEPDLNFYKPGDDSDTSTPEAMAKSLKSFTTGEDLPLVKQELLINWLKGNQTGDTLIRAGLPADWEVGDRTGAATYATRNAIAVAYPPGRDPVYISIFSNKDTEDAEYNDEMIEKATKEAVRILEE